VKVQVECYFENQFWIPNHHAWKESNRVNERNIKKEKKNQKTSD
jgi:hypothetical protein